MLPFKSHLRPLLRAVGIDDDHPLWLMQRFSRFVELRRGCPTAGVDLLGAMLERESDNDDPNNRLSAAEIEATAGFLVVAGKGTTARAIAFALYCLVTHEDVQERLRRELHDDFEAPYLEHVLCEALRLYPPVPLTSREMMPGVSLVDGMTLPVRVGLQCPIWTLHRDEAVFDEPLAFRPERHDSSARFSTIAYQPFGTGPRHCIGKALARTIIRHAVRAIITRFRLSACERTDQPMLQVKFVDTVTDPCNGVWARVTKIE